jgi:hypothetical protein
MARPARETRSRCHERSSPVSRTLSSGDGSTSERLELVYWRTFFSVEKSANPGLLGVAAIPRAESDTTPIAAAAPSQIKVIDLIPASLSGETNQDSEPFLAVQTANPQVMVASAFTPNPFSNMGNAPVYVSQAGGSTWALNAITPVPKMTCDITHAIATAENHPRGDLRSG